MRTEESLNARSGPGPATAGNARRIHGEDGVRRATRGSQYGPRSAAIPARSVDSAEEVGAFRANLPDFVPPQLQNLVYVLDIGLASVKIVALPEGRSQSTYQNIARSLGLRKVHSEYIATPGAMIELRERIRNLPRVGNKSNDEELGKQLYEDLVRGAFERNANDIHVRTNIADGQSHVKLRINGRMRHWLTFDSRLMVNALRSAYGSITKDGTNSRAEFSIDVEASTMTELKLPKVKVNGRFNHSPILGGGKTVIRLQPTPLDLNDFKVATFEELGYMRSQIDRELMPMLRKSSGMFVISGSTGSGKTTALQTMLYQIPGRENLSMYSAEDPAELPMPWVDQMTIQSSADDSLEVRRKKFQSTLNRMLRMDPDVGMIGELRDAETALIGFELARTGHRAFSTVHGDGSVDVLPRLAGELLRVPTDVLASAKSFSGSMYQRLLPKLCPSCRIPAKGILPSEMTQALTRKFGLDMDLIHVANEDGCEECQIHEINTHGTTGQLVAAEILIPTPPMRAAILRRDWEGVEKMWRGRRVAAFDQPDMTGKTAFEHALYLVSQGVVDPRDIEAEFEPLDTYVIHEAQAGVA